MPGPTFLRGDRVDLRPIDRDDLDFLRRHRNDPDVWHTLDRSGPQNERQVEAWHERASEDDDAVHLLACVDGSPVGYVGLTRMNSDWGNGAVSFWVAPEAQGEGYGTAAADLALGYAFDHRRWHKALAFVFEGNPASHRLVERLGFREEGVHRDEAFVAGEYVDVHAYGLLAGEWRAAPG